MIGLKISCIALLLALPLVSTATEVEVLQLEDIQLVSIEALADENSILHDVEIVSEPLPMDTKVDILLAKARQENAARTNMRRAELSETECLATALYHEARGEGERGQKAVAFVIHNRAQSPEFPDGYCNVILQPKQFSFVGDRNPDSIREWEIYEKLLAMAVELVENDGFQRMSSPVGNALFFDSFPRMVARGRKFVAKIGNHHFFAR